MIKNNKKYKKKMIKTTENNINKKKTKKNQKMPKTQTNKQTKPITRHKTISWSDTTPCVSGDDLCTGCTKGQSLRKTVLFRTLPTTDEHTPKYKTIKKKKKNPQVEQCWNHCGAVKENKTRQNNEMLVWFNTCKTAAPQNASEHTLNK